MLRSLTLLFVLVAAVGVGFAATHSTDHSTDHSTETATGSAPHPSVQDDEPTGDDEAGDKKADEKKAKEPGPRPKFTDPENVTRFDDAVALFQDEQWKDAKKAFKACQSGEPKEVKKQLEPWLSACKGGPSLTKVDRAIDKSKWKEAWRQLEKVRARYGETPLETKISILSETVEKQLFIMLATFEEDAPEGEREVANTRPDNSKINTDKKYVRKGKRSLTWNAGRVGLGNPGGRRLFAYLPIAAVEGEKLDEYRYLHLSLFATEENAGRFTLFLDTGETANMNPLQTRCFYKHINLEKPGWNDLRVDLWKDMASYTTPKREEVERIALIVIPPANPKRIYIDDVKLEKK